MSTECTYYAVKSNAPPEIIYYDLGRSSPHSTGLFWEFSSDYYHDVNTYVRYKSKEILFDGLSSVSPIITKDIADTIMTTIRNYRSDLDWHKALYSRHTWGDMPDKYDIWYEKDFESFESFLMACIDGGYKLVRHIV